MPCVPNSTSEARSLSSPPTTTEGHPSRTTPTCTSGGISSRIASNDSKSSVASPRATTRPTQASLPPSISLPPSSHFDECLQSLERDDDSSNRHHALTSSWSM